MQRNGTTYAQGAWTLSKLLAAPEGEPVDSVLSKLEELVSTFEGARDRLTPDISNDDFTALLDQTEAIMTEALRMYAYANLWFTENTQEQKALAFMGKAQQVITDVQNRTLFFELWWKGLDDDNAARLMDDAGDRRYYLYQLRLTKDHVLAEAQEQLINIKNANGIQALDTVYEMLTNAFKYMVEVDGEVKPHTREQLMALVRTPDADLRARAYQELYRVFGEQGLVLAQIYTHRVRDWREEFVKLRKYGNPMMVRNKANDIPDEAVNILLDVTRDNASVFHRWFALKAGYIGMDKLRRYDVYAPLAPVDRTVDYNDAVHTVLDSLSDFHPDLHNAAKTVFDADHIHSEIRPGKRGGAFCYGVLPSIAPYVMVNYAGKLDDVGTLAHELGHAIHAVLSNKHSLLVYDPSLPLAETASVFSEMLLTDRLLAGEQDPLVKRNLLARLVDDAFATVLRQAYFAIWENTAHEMIMNGASVDELNAAYLENLREQFGPDMEIGDEFKWEWVSIPHIYQVPFYVYAYSFGQLLVYALYQRYQELGDDFKPQYIKLLTYGGSASPEDILTEAGIDIRSREFWQGGFDYIASMIDRLEQLEQQPA